jgi:acyl carrier protein
MSDSAALSGDALTCVKRFDESQLHFGVLQIGASMEFERPVSPRTPLEAALTDIVARALGVATIGLDDHFVELGCDSIRAAEVVVAIEDRFGIALPLTVVFEHPTVAALAREMVR